MTRVAECDNAYDAELLALLGELVAVESFSGNEGAVQARIAAWFERQGIAARIEPADGGLTNLVVEISGNSEGRALWIGGHCDTVGISNDWVRPPLKPTIEGARLYGRGAMDMKGGLAAAMDAVRVLHFRKAEWSGKIVFAALADEEAYSRGANAFVRQERGIDAAIMCEPHFDDVVIGAMGKINLKVEVKGRSAHGSRPEEGVNAIVEAARLIAALDALERFDHPQFGKASHCVLNVRSGDGRYEIRVPDHCEFVINWHLMPGETVPETVAAIEQLAASLGSKASFAVSVGEPRYESFVIEADHPLLGQFAASYRAVIGKAPDFRFGRGVSDANIFAGRCGIPTLLFGPDGAGMHAGDEWVNLDRLHLARAVYVDFALRFLNSDNERQCHED